MRIYGHYPFIDGKNTTYHRCVISIFNIVPTIEGDKRWKIPTFVQNVQDLWAVEYFQTICSAVDMLQLEAEASQRSAPSQSTQNSRRSGQSQQLEDSEIVDELQTGDPLITPNASTHTVRKKQQRTAETAHSWFLSQTPRPSTPPRLLNRIWFQHWSPYRLLRRSCCS